MPGSPAPPLRSRRWIPGSGTRSWRLISPNLQRYPAGDSASQEVGRRGDPGHVIGRRALRLCEPQPLFDGEVGADRLHQDTTLELGEYVIRANAILPGTVHGPRIQRVFEGRAKVSGKSLDEVKQEAMSIQSLKRMVDPKDIAALAVFLASDAGKSISGQMLPIDNDMQQAS